MKNIIVERIYDFLKNFPPFHVLSKNDLMVIAKNVKVIYLENDQYIFKQGDKSHNHFYIVNDGAIGLRREEFQDLVDKCDEGDIFGLRSLISKDNYSLSAKAIEESIIYSISSVLLEEIINRNTEANKFLIASFATNTRNPYSSKNKGKLFANIDVLKKNESDFTEALSADYSKNPITCELHTTIKNAAKIMTNKHVGSIIIIKNDKPLGIITDKDLRTKIATGKFTIDQEVSNIMSSPVIAYPEKITIAEAQIAMLQHKVTHLCITKNGTPDSELVGILSEHDIIVVRGNNPSVILKEIKRAKSIEGLRTINEKTQHLLKLYLEQKLPIFFVSKIISTINNTITQKVIELTLKKVSSKIPTTFAWLALGSQGRSEQLLLTDQDNALVFENVSKENHKATKDYFLNISKTVTKSLHTIGFEYCPADMMASNPKWCLSVNEWKNTFDNWITRPNEKKIMLSTIFFDFERIYGNDQLVSDMTSSIYHSIHKYEIFLNYLGLNALKNPPPLGFFRNFLVENGGEHKDQFDIKAKAIMPLVDAARLLTLATEIKKANNTILRFKKLTELEPQNKDLYESCIDSFKILLRFRTTQGLKHGDSGRYVDINSLNKVDRLKLKGCFKPIKDIQELIRVRFNLAQMM